MFLNIGPHHPSTHGVLHVKAVLDGETVVDVDPDIGYIHRCEEQMCQQSTYRHQIMPYPDRWDWVSSGLLNEWAYARAAEDLADIAVPDYAQVIRTMGAELSRLASHFIAVGTYALDIVGEFCAAFQYGIRDRELVLDALEELTGQRMMFNYFRLGGVAWDLPEPRGEFIAGVRDILDSFPAKIDEYHDLLVSNEIFQRRCVDTGILEPEAAKDYGCTGPVARGSGIDYDLRRDDPYGTIRTSSGTSSPNPTATTSRGCSFDCGRSRSPRRSSSSVWIYSPSGPRTNGPFRATSPGRSSPPPTPNSTAPSRGRKANSGSTSARTGPTRRRGSRSAAPVSRTSPRCPRSPAASTSPI